MCRRSPRSVQRCGCIRRKRKPIPTSRIGSLMRWKRRCREDLGRLDARQVSDALAYVTARIGRRRELFQNPERPPGWVLSEPATLQACGQASRQNIRSIIALAADRPRLASRSPAAFSMLVRGRSKRRGADAMSVVAGCRPGYLGTILGVGPCQCRRHVYSGAWRFRAGRHATRRACRVLAGAAWLLSFMARLVAEAALDRLAAALAPNGDLVASLFTIPTKGHIHGLRICAVVAMYGT